MHGTDDLHRENHKYLDPVTGAITGLSHTVTHPETGRTWTTHIDSNGQLTGYSSTHHHGQNFHRHKYTDKLKLGAKIIDRPDGSSTVHYMDPNDASQVLRTKHTQLGIDGNCYEIPGPHNVNM